MRVQQGIRVSRTRVRGLMQDIEIDVDGEQLKEAKRDRATHNETGQFSGCAE